MTNAVIDIRSLSQKYGSMKALDEVSLQVAPGTVYGLVGPNGSGKTTLVRALCGLEKPSSGSATVLGFDVGTHPTEIRNRVGYMSQRFSLYNDLTARENIEFFAQVYGVVGAKAKQRIDEVIALTKLEPYLARPCFVLSGGWRQRVALATTILHRPPLAFLDEPTAGIDPVARRDLWDLLFSLAAEGTDFFITTQYMDEIERCGEVGYLYLSKLIVTGTPAELKGHRLVTAAGTRYVELECTNAIQAVNWLRAASYCKDATVFGHSVHALVTDDAADASIRSDATGAGFSKVSVRTIEPNLEDVFVALTRYAVAQKAKS
ncbi:ABC transporter ATP-binding protein [soil metagenome]